METQPGGYQEYSQLGAEQLREALLGARSERGGNFYESKPFNNPQAELTRLRELSEIL